MFGKDSVPNFIARQLFGRLSLETASLSGKTVIVTGANVGLGKETARHLATMKPGRLILACRNTQKGQEAADDIASTTSYKGIEVWELDLGDFASVKKFAKRINQELDRLDIFIENAGIATDKWSETVDGYESTLQVNVISTTMLALLSLPKLRETVKKYHAKPRLVLVGSEVHFWAKFAEHKSPTPLAELNKKDSFVPGDRYYVSKLLDMLITQELGNRLASSSHPEDKSIFVNCPNPGLCHSELSRNDDGYSLLILKTLFARNTEYGARNFVFAALAEQNTQGAYVSDCTFTEPSDFVLSEEGASAQAKVWQELQNTFKEKCPEAIAIF